MGAIFKNGTIRYLINCLCNNFFKLSKDFMDTLYIINFKTTKFFKFNINFIFICPNRLFRLQPSHQRHIPVFLDADPKPE